MLIQESLCVEVLFFTVCLWISLFGITELLLENCTFSQKLMVYITIGLVSLCTIHSQQNTNVCSLM